MRRSRRLSLVARRRLHGGGGGGGRGLGVGSGLGVGVDVDRGGRRRGPGRPDRPGCHRGVRRLLGHEARHAVRTVRTRHLLLRLRVSDPRRCNGSSILLRDPRQLSKEKFLKDGLTGITLGSKEEFSDQFCLSTK